MGTATALRSSTETERKYETAASPPPDLTAALTTALAGAGPVATLRERDTAHLEAVYYDTPGRRLAADGITLRRRTGGDDAGWHLKLPLADGVREEIHAPLGATLPKSLAGLVRSRIRREELLPLLTLRTERDRRDLLDAGGRVLAELAVDRVTAERVEPVPDHADDGEALEEVTSAPAEHTARWTEIEVELADGADPGVLDAVEERLADAGLARSAHPSKLRRALAETGAEPAARRVLTLPAGTAGAHVLAYARRQLRALVELDPAVRREQPDAVHQMRVVTRRLRSCFRTFSTVWHPGVTGSLADGLRWLAAELGADRDREVLADRLGARVAELPSQLRRGPLQRRLHTVTRTHRAGTRKSLLAVLDSEKYLALLDALDAALIDGCRMRKGARRPAREELDEAVRRDRRRLVARVDAALALPPGPERDAALHTARKAAKRARYAAEASRKALGKPAKAQIARFTEVQQVLGEHQDSVMAREALLRIASVAQRAGEPSFSYGVLHEREAALAAASEETLARLPI
ncbi:CYTH and CHAD domain-containing protein [Streptomyces sp. 6N223]|uniref:CYTH and CHAD domain-containing protein n=1 Tax=Streptomyces sp. 6N223 TaxID=3457412 RepID=UPI003FD63BA8